MKTEDWIIDGIIPGEESVGKSYLFKLETVNKDIKYEVGVIYLNYDERDTGNTRTVKGVQYPIMEKYLKESLWMFNNYTFVYKQDMKVIGYMEII